MLPMQFSASGLPYFAPPVLRTDGGTSYLKESGCALISRPHVDLSGVADFLGGFEPALGFPAYLDDPDVLPDPERLVKFAGQLCYLSLGKDRTSNAEAARYLENIKKSRHGSVVEHANYTFLFWGVDRSFTHELVRHRAGWSYSQTSQRYVDASRLRFVMRPEYQWDRLAATLDPAAMRQSDLDALRSEVVGLADSFCADVDRARRRYEATAARLAAARDSGHPMLAGASKTELRKHLNQVARESLPNSTEAPIVATANARAFRHGIEMRAAGPADVPIRDLFGKVLACLRHASPLLFSDYRPDGVGFATDHVKI